MKLTMATSYLATILILMMLAVASAQEKQDNFEHYGMSSHGHHHKGSKRGGHHHKGHKRGGHHHKESKRHSKKFHPMGPKKMDFDDVEELLRIHQIKAALQEEKIGRSADTVSSWRSSSSSSSSSSSDLSSSSSFDGSTQGAIEPVVDEKITMKHVEEEGVVRMDKEIP